MTALVLYCSTPGGAIHIGIVRKVNKSKKEIRRTEKDEERGKRNKCGVNGSPSHLVSFRQARRVSFKY